MAEIPSKSHRGKLKIKPNRDD